MKSEDILTRTNGSKYLHFWPLLTVTIGNLLFCTNSAEMLQPCCCLSDFKFALKNPSLLTFNNSKLGHPYFYTQLTGKKVYMASHLLGASYSCVHCLTGTPGSWRLSRTRQDFWLLHIIQLRVMILMKIPHCDGIQSTLVVSYTIAEV